MKLKAKAKERKAIQKSERSPPDADDEREATCSAQDADFGRSGWLVPKKPNEGLGKAGSNTGSNIPTLRHAVACGGVQQSPQMSNFQYEVEVEDEVSKVEPPAVMKMNEKPVEMDPIEMNRFLIA
jgi:hypothetical protein